MLEVRGAQQMIDVDESGLGQRAQRLRRDHQHVLAHDLLDLDAAGLDLAIRRGVLAQRKQGRVVVGRDGGMATGAFMGAPMQRHSAIYM